jgi:hypothetical protein
MNMIVAMLCKAPPAFEPILYEGEGGRRDDSSGP